MLGVIAVGQVGTVERLNSFEVNCSVALDDVLERVSEAIAEAVRDEEVADGVGHLVVGDVEEDGLLRGVHDREVVGDVIVLGHAGLSEVEEAHLCAGNVDLNGLRRDSLGHEHIMVGHHDGVASVKGLLLGLEEVIRVIQVDALLPSLARSLVSLHIRLMGDENPGFMVLPSVRVSRAVGGHTPGEVEHVVLHVLPGGSHVLSRIKLLVDLARLVVSEVFARSPSGGQGPGPLLGMEMELVDALARVEGAEVGSAVLGNPVDALSAGEDDEVVVNWALHDLANFADVL
mmetsp:Transcript_29703/g.45281  ORF Transcript_29703/g.45281 Transcript_29703/m.45281 type:complete len:288 (+) Transcript_29703:1730-2593(+)